MKFRFLAVLVLGLSCVVGGEAFVHAEDFPYGTVLFLETLSEGTAEVKVIDGNIANTQGGLDVVLVTISNDKKLDGKTRRSRTDNRGIARFVKLVPGRTYVAKVVKKSGLSDGAQGGQGGGEDVLTNSESFSLPKGVGASVLLSISEAGPVPKPPSTAGAGQTAASNTNRATQRPPRQDGVPPMLQNPRKVSGIARGEEKDPAGQLTVRAVQGTFRASEAGLTADFPRDTPIYLIGYLSDGSVHVETQPIKDDGRATFSGLERGTASYYVASVFPRGDRYDRLLSKPFQMPPQVGMRVMLAGEAIDSKADGVDDFAAQGQPPAQPGAGEVVAHVLVAPEKKDEAASIVGFELVRADTNEVVAESGPMKLSPRASDISGKAIFMDSKSMPETKAGSIGVGAFRPSKNQPLGGVSVAVREAGEAGTPATEKPLAEGITSENGLVVFEKEDGAFKAGKKYQIFFEVKGKSLISDPFEYQPNQSHAVAAIADWAEGDISVRFSNLSKTLKAKQNGTAKVSDALYIVRTKGGDAKVMSLPFQLTPNRGAAVNMYMYPDVLFGFHASGEVEDDKMWFQVQVLLQNPNQTPYAKEGGIHVPLPEGFKNPSVPEEMASRIKILPKKGITFRGALPPGTSRATVTFSLPVEDGTVNVGWDLPFGLLCPPFENNSGGRGPPCFVISDLPGSILSGIPKPVEPRKVSLSNGKSYFVIDRISIPPGKRLAFDLTNLPQDSAWQRRLKNGTGVIVLAVVFLSLLFAIRTRLLLAKRGQGPARMKRERLLDQMVQLESRRRRGRVEAADFETERTRLMTELESLVEEHDLGNLHTDDRPGEPEGKGKGSA